MIPEITALLIMCVAGNILLGLMIWAEYAVSVDPRTDAAEHILAHRDEDGSMEMRMFVKGIFSFHRHILYILGVNICAWLAVIWSILTESRTAPFDAMFTIYMLALLFWIGSLCTKKYYRRIASEMLDAKYPEEVSGCPSL